MINVILQFLGLDRFNIKLSAKFYQNIPNGLRVKFHFFQNLILGKTTTTSQMSFDNLVGYILSEPMCMQNFITFFHSFQEIGLFSPTNPKCHLTISWATSCQYQCVCKNFITVFHSVQEIGPFSLFQNLERGKTSTDVKCNFAT